MMKELVDAVLAEFQELLTGERKRMGAGLAGLDEMTKGLRAGDLWVIGGRAVAGKSTLLRQVAGEAGLRGGMPVFVFSPTMPARDWVGNLLYAEAGYSLDGLMRGETPSKGDLRRLQAAAQALGGSALVVDDGDYRVMEIFEEKVRGLVMEKGTGLVVVDDFYPMDFHADAVRRLKRLAMEMELPVLVTMALGGTGLRGPVAGDLEDGAAVMRWADVVCLMNRGMNDGPLVEAEIQMVKNRRGRTGSLRLRFDLERHRLEEWRDAEEGEIFTQRYF